MNKKLIAKAKKKLGKISEIESERKNVIRFNYGIFRYRVADLGKDEYRYLVERVGNGILSSDEHAQKIENKLLNK